ncbi:Hsp33 family molecular chaperone [Lentilitoribacter sp. EG35]|jgi:molecular chaperone Hsp33|uniref:Hsp33 family molecular chaperone n=1 Tax=Lentilitoribacter sp. EG35 TaxID=3234192 RepID=UPI00346159BA
MESFEQHTDDLKLSGDDHVVPFQVEGLDVRGRVVQLGPMLDQILSRHNYPDLVAQLLAEAAVLTVLLGTSLKFEGRLILQTKGDGPVELLVADFQAPDALRAYAQFDQAKLDLAIADGMNQPHQLLGKGVMAFTIDQGAHMQRYQGIVEMKGETLSDMAETYFRQSEQIPTEIKLGIAELITKEEDATSQHQWRAGGLLMQFLPHSPDRMRQADLPGGDVPHGSQEASHAEDDVWVEAKALLQTVKANELTDPQIGSERLLYRLFHERGVRIYDAQKVDDRCSCSREKLFGVLSKMEPDELQETAIDGKISVVCEFCSTEHAFTMSDF